jgi:hypothetical protein
MISGVPHIFTWPVKPSATNPFVTADGNFDVRHLQLAKDSEANLRSDI